MIAPPQFGAAAGRRSAKLRLAAVPKPPPNRGCCISGHPTSGSLEGRLRGQDVCQATACRYHLARVQGSDRPGRRFPGKPGAPDRLLPNVGVQCALDVADSGPKTSEETARFLGLSGAGRGRRVEQILVDALGKLEGSPLLANLAKQAGFVDHVAPLIDRESKQPRSNSRMNNSEVAVEITIDGHAVKLEGRWARSVLQSIKNSPSRALANHLRLLIEQMPVKP